MEGGRGLLEGGAGASVAGWGRGLGGCCCLLFGILDRQQQADQLASAGLLGAGIRQKATDSAEKFAESKKMHCCAAHCYHGGWARPVSFHFDPLMEMYASYRQEATPRLCTPAGCP